MPEIDPTRLYSFSEATRLLPSTHAGKRLHLRTLHRWRAAGLIKAVCQPRERLRYWYVWGSELLRILGGPPPAPELTPQERASSRAGGVEAARKWWAERRARKQRAKR